MKKLHDMIGGRDKTLRGPRIIDTLNRNILLIFEHDLRYIIIPDSWFKYFSLPFVPSGNNETKKALGDVAPHSSAKAAIHGE